MAAAMGGHKPPFLSERLAALHMVRDLLRRLMLIVPTLFGIIVNFTLRQFVPGGPIRRVLRSLSEGLGAVTKWIGIRITIAVDAFIRGAFTALGAAAATALGAAAAARAISLEKIEPLARKIIDIMESVF